LALEEILKLFFGVSNMINNFLKHSSETQVDTQADVAAAWVSAELIIISIS